MILAHLSKKSEDFRSIGASSEMKTVLSIRMQDSFVDLGIWRRLRAFIVEAMPSNKPEALLKRKRCLILQISDSQ